MGLFKLISKGAGLVSSLASGIDDVFGGGKSSKVFDSMGANGDGVYSFYQTGPIDWIIRQGAEAGQYTVEAVNLTKNIVNLTFGETGLINNGQSQTNLAVVKMLAPYSSVDLKELLFQLNTSSLLTVSNSDSPGTVHAAANIRSGMLHGSVNETSISYSVANMGANVPFKICEIAGKPIRGQILIKQDAVSDKNASLVCAISGWPRGYSGSVLCDVTDGDGGIYQQEHLQLGDFGSETSSFDIELGNNLQVTNPSMPMVNIRITGHKDTATDLLNTYLCGTFDPRYAHLLD